MRNPAAPRGLLRLQQSVSAHLHKRCGALLSAWQKLQEWYEPRSRHGTAQAARLLRQIAQRFNVPPVLSKKRLPVRGREFKRRVLHVLAMALAYERQHAWRVVVDDPGLKGCLSAQV